MDSAANNRLIPVVDWNKYHLWPPLGGLRHLIFHGAKNGFDAVVRRCGRRVLIDEQAFFAWLAASNQGRTVPPQPRGRSSTLPRPNRHGSGGR